MPTTIKLKIRVIELDNVLTQFNQIKVWRSDTGIAGTYNEITKAAPGTPGRIAIVAGRTLYEFDDTLGEVDSYYKTSYFHTGTLLESNLGQPRLGSDPATANIMTTQELLDIYLFGVDLTDDDGNAYPDIVYDWSIRYAISWLEHELDLTLRPTKVTERYDYYRRDYQSWVFIKTRHSPVINDLEGVDLTTPRLDLTRVEVIWPSNQTVLEFNQEWIHIREDTGMINLIPAAGTLSQVLLTSGGSFLPLLAEGRDFVPDLFKVTYTHGFREGQVPRALRELVGKKAAFGPLNLAGDLLGGAGIASQSIGIDGLSQSFNTTCLHGNSPVAIVGGDRPIRDVVLRAHDGERQLAWCMDERTRRLTPARIVGAVESGVKPLYDLEVAGAGPVRMSRDHRCLTERGWLRLHQAVDLATLTPRVRFQTATGLQPAHAVKPAGEHPTYDIEVRGPWHNFVCDGLVLHNSSATNAGYGARLLQYEREIKQAIPTLKRFYRGIPMVVV